MKWKNCFFRFFAASLFAAYLAIVIMPNSKSLQVSATTISSSKGECVMEMRSRRVLFEERGDYRLPMASTTKVLTCITVLELCKDIQTEYAIPEDAVGIEGSSVYLQVGDVYTVEDLLYGLMLRSGNDCATALALFCSGSIANFTVEMNKTAQKAGALNSNFENPHGLPHKNHYTTARDLCYISAYAMHNATFQKIVSTKYYEKRQWKNKNKMLYNYEGGIGIKTGYTKEAGRCLVTAATKDDTTLICVVLNSPNMYERSAKLLNDGFASYSNIKLISKGEKLQIDGSNITGIVGKDYYYPLLKEEIDFIEIKTKACKRKYMQKRELVGEFEIYLAKRLLFSGNLYKL